MNLLLKLECGVCGAEFPVNTAEFAVLGFQDLPKACPACLDRSQMRPDVTVSREEIFSAVCTVSADLPWEHFQGRPGDVPVWRFVRKGRHYGAAWHGRIDLFAVGFGEEAPRRGSIVMLTEMRTVKRVAYQVSEQMVRATGETYTVRVQVDIQSDEADEVVERERTYVRLMPTDLDPASRALVFVEAYTKTTLKGFGRQYHAHIEGDPLWKCSTSGGYRSGRAHTTAVLAVVCEEHPLVRVHREGGAEERMTYPPEELF